MGARFSILKAGWLDVLVDSCRRTFHIVNRRVGVVVFLSSPLVDVFSHAKSAYAISGWGYVWVESAKLGSSFVHLGRRLLSLGKGLVHCWNVKIILKMSTQELGPCVDPVFANLFVGRAPVVRLVRMSKTDADYVRRQSLNKRGQTGKIPCCSSTEVMGPQRFQKSSR